MELQQRLRLIKWVNILILLESVALFLWLLSLPRDPKNAWVLGFSFRRFVLLMPSLLLNFGSLWGVIQLRRNNGWKRTLDRKITAFAKGNSTYYLTVLFLGMFFLVGGYFLLIGSTITDIYFQAYFIRLAPYVVWGQLFSIQLIVLLRLSRNGVSLQAFSSEKRAFIAFVLALSVMILLGIWITWTKIGLEPDLVGWGDPGIPIIPTQIAFVLGITLALLMLRVLIQFINQKKIASTKVDFSSFFTEKRFDIIIFIVLWGLTILQWKAEPLKPSYFSPEPLPPNYEYYPYSDAANYDRSAHQLLIGNGFEDNVRRPMLSAFFALVQATNGIGYQNVLDWQIPILALIPPLLYLLARELHHWGAGLLVGFLAIIHEGNAIALSGLVNVSHTKLLMSDLPTALGVIFVTLMFILWAKKPIERRLNLLVVGGVLAIFTLIRIQIFLLGPVFFILIWILTPRKKTAKVQNSFLLILGIILVLIPWLFRNWQATGKITFSEATQASQLGLIGERYAVSPDLDESAVLAGETENEYANRIIDRAFQFVFTNPGEASRFIAAHYFHNQVSTALVLPVNFTLAENINTFYGLLPHWEGKLSKLWLQCCSLDSYVSQLPYWDAWDGEWLELPILPLLFNAVVVAVGIGAAWKRNHLIGLIPILINITYSFGNALVRTSGWRFNLPVDWIAILYYGIGLVQIIFWIVMLFSNRSIRDRDEEIMGNATETFVYRPFPRKAAILVGLIFFLLSVAIPLAENSISSRFDIEQVQDELKNLDQQGRLSQVGIDTDFVEQFLKQDQAVILIGRGLYPRFYLAGQGEPGKGWPSFRTRDFNRLGFYLIGPNSKNIILPSQTSPTYFPHGADVLLLGCSREEFVEAEMIAILDSSSPIIIGDTLHDWKCQSVNH